LAGLLYFSTPLPRCSDAIIQSVHGIGDPRSGTGADEEKSGVAGLAGPARKILDGIDSSLFKLIEGCVVPAGKSLTETGNTGGPLSANLCSNSAPLRDKMQEDFPRPTTEVTI
jgi:hypothetical protein